MTLIVPPVTRRVTRTEDRHPLPAWPVLFLLGGLPVWWVAGLFPFLPVAALALLGALMVVRRRDLTMPGGAVVLLGFAAWVIPCALMVDTGERYIGYGMRAATVFSLPVLYVYLHNCSRRLTRDHLLMAATSVWTLIVLGGLLGTLLPDVRLPTPVGSLLPAAITANDFVRDLVNPPLAEVQQPWGADEPFNRPSAPFPYANGWGSGFALSLPIVIAAVLLVRRRWFRIAVVVLAGLAVVPVVASLNRGMFLMLGVSAAYVALRQVCLGRIRSLAVLAAGALVAGAVLVQVGVLSDIAERQEVSDTTSGRASIYAATVTEVLRSPVLGWGAPRPSEDIGINLGTQGALWMYLFSYGVVGAALFVGFLITAAVSTSRAVGDSATAWLHSVPVAALVGSLFYGYDFVQWVLVLVALALLTRGGPIRRRVPPASSPARSAAVV